MVVDIDTAKVELSELALDQMSDNQVVDDSEQIQQTLAVINFLKIAILGFIGLILSKYNSLIQDNNYQQRDHVSFVTVQQIFYRLFATKASKKAPANVKPSSRMRNTPQARTRRQGSRPTTRAEALLIMLENNGCPPEQL